MLKHPLIAGLALASVALSGCLSTAGIAGGTAASPGIDVAALKEVNRHIELCHRTYAWPFAFVIECPAQVPAPPPAAQALTAADVAAMIDQAVAKAVAALKTTPTR